MLSCENIKFYYDKSTTILNDISLQLEPNKIVGLVGPSGYGKSTLAQILAGYLNPISGEVIYNDKRINDYKMCPVQLIYQHPEKAIDPLWKMEKVISEGVKISERVIKGLEIKDIWMTRYPNELSGGELQRFNIARALSEGTQYIIADEITTMLDPITQSNLWHFVLNECKSRNIGMLVVTHNMHLADKICDYVIDVTKL